MNRTGGSVKIAGLPERGKRTGSFMVEMNLHTTSGEYKWIATHHTPFGTAGAAEREYNRNLFHKQPLRIMNRGVECELTKPAG